MDGRKFCILEVDVSTADNTTVSEEMTSIELGLVLRGGGHAFGGSLVMVI